MRKILWVLVGAVLWVSSLLSPVAAKASGACPGGRPSGNGQCVAQIDRNTVCAWPMLFNGERVTFCIQAGDGN